MDDDNGILAAVPGEHISRASHTLPDPATAEQDRMSAVIDAGWAGRVQISFLRYRYRSGRSITWAWTAYRADREPPVRTAEPRRVCLGLRRLAFFGS
jgi:hypothetical protein